MLKDHFQSTGHALAVTFILLRKKNCSYMTYAKKPQHYEKIQLNLIISCYFRQLLVGE